MSETSQVEQEQESPRQREPETGRLLPLWFEVTFYAIFLPITLVGFGIMGHSFVVQHRLVRAIRTLSGDLEEVLPSFGDPRFQEAVEALMRHPVKGFLFANQEILQDVEDDPRMSRVLALQKATRWGTVSSRRQVAEQILENMDEHGQIPPEVLTEDVREVLWDIIAERHANPALLPEGEPSEQAIEAATRAMADELRAEEWLNPDRLEPEVHDTVWAMIVRRQDSREPLPLGETAVGWVRGRLTARLLEHLEDADPAQLEDEVRHVVWEIIDQRPPDIVQSYAEERITDVLRWLARGVPTRPTGVERRRLVSYLAGFEKKVFVGPEIRALRRLIAEWSEDENPLAREAAEEFEKMLDEEVTQLSPEVAALCFERADELEDRYSQGLKLLARASAVTLERIVEDERFLDHPHIYQYIFMLSKPYEEVRDSILDGLWLIRHKYFTVRFVSHFATRTEINPVMAAETARLSREEHERILTEQNNRRMRECTELLVRIGLDYVENTDHYAEELQPRDMRRYVIHALELLREDERVGQIAQEGLDRIREADLARPGEPLFFTETG